MKVFANAGGADCRSGSAEPGKRLEKYLELNSTGT